MYHILVVDDEVRIRTIIKKYAEFEGHTVSVSLGSVESMWPRAQRRHSGNKEGN